MTSGSGAGGNILRADMDLPQVDKQVETKEPQPVSDAVQTNLGMDTVLPTETQTVKSSILQSIHG